MDNVVHRFAPAPGALDNPLKGWCTYTDGELFLSYSMAFRYVSWRELEPTEGDYRFAQWEAKSWNDANTRDKHIVLRVYLDYPGLPSGVPSWLLAKGVKTTSYTDNMEGYPSGTAKGQSPDYNNPLMVAALEKLIAAMGKRYNKHPQIGFVQIGLLGFWGEWHTYPREELFADTATQMRVIDAYRRAFPDKKLMARYAKGYPGKQSWLGFHDDYFPEDTGTEKDYYFLRGMQESRRLENWRVAPVGGEMIPSGADKWVGTDAGLARTEAMIRAAHFSWIGPYSPTLEKRARTDAGFRARCDALVRLMGYQFRLSELSLPKVIRTGSPFAVSTVGKNEGVAPFYYPWQLQAALVAENDSVVETVALSRTDIRTWQPGTFRIAESVRFAAPPGSYQLALGIINPLTQKPAIRLANKIAVSKNGWHKVAPIVITR